MRNKVPDIYIILTILLVSALSGIVYNSFNSNGLPLVAGENKLTWADDSLISEADSAYRAFIPLEDSASYPEDKVSNTKELAGTVKKSRNPDSTDKNSTALPPSGKATNKVEATNRAEPPKAINLHQALKLYKSGRSVFIDARDKWDFADGHIKGAINIPQVSFDMHRSRIGPVPKDAVIVTYCSQPDCELSEKLAHELYNMGYGRVFIYKGGWEEWLSKGYETEGTVKNEQ